MKKLITLIAMGSVLLSGAIYAQDHEPVRARDGSGSDQFGVLRRLQENQGIQECVGEYREARDAFRQELQQLRQRLATASGEDQAAIKEQIREQLMAHRGEQREFRKNLRGIMRQLRKQRTAAVTGDGS